MATLICSEVIIDAKGGCFGREDWMRSHAEIELAL